MAGLRGLVLLWCVVSRAVRERPLRLRDGGGVLLPEGVGGRDVPLPSGFRLAPGSRFRVNTGMTGLRGEAGAWEQPCFAGNGFRFFTPLCFVQNDSSVWVPVIDESGSIGEVPPPLWIPAGPGFTLSRECRNDGFAVRRVFECPLLRAFGDQGGASVSVSSGSESFLVFWAMKAEGVRHESRMRLIASMTSPAAMDSSTAVRACSLK